MVHDKIHLTEKSTETLLDLVVEALGRWGRAANLGYCARGRECGLRVLQAVWTNKIQEFGVEFLNFGHANHKTLEPWPGMGCAREELAHLCEGARDGFRG